MYHSKFAENLINIALEAGADSAEVYLSEKTETEITVSNNRPESVNIKTDNGFGLRILVESKLGFYSSNKFEELGVVENVRQLVKATSLHTPDPYNYIPDPQPQNIADVDEVFDPSIIRIPLTEKIEKAIEIERTGRGFDDRIQGFIWLQYGDMTERYRIINSAGLDIDSAGSICYGFGYCFASDHSSSQTGRYARAYGRFDQFDSELIGQQAARYALRSLGAQAFDGAVMTAMLPPETGIHLMHALFSMIEADSIQKGKSPFRKKLGKKVASSPVTIIDDGTLPGGLSTRPYDSEGIPCTRTVVVENGVLKNYLYDSYTARKGRTNSTGNASRSGYHDRPHIHPTNFYLQSGVQSPVQIMKGIKKGILITELSGLHAGINLATADFSVPAKGILIEKGELESPVENISISGNLFDFLNNITDIGNDLSWEPIDGMIGTPTFVVEDLKIVGKK